MKLYYSKRYPGVFHYFKKGHRKNGFRLTYYDNQHKRHEIRRTGFHNINRALSRRDEIMNHYQALKDSRNMTVGEWCRHVINERKTYRTTTYKSYAHLLGNYIIPYIGKYKLVDLIPDIYRRYCWQKLIERGLSANTIKDTNARIQTAMNEAVDNKLIQNNPIKRPRMSKALERSERPRKPIMNRKQLIAFNDCLNRHSMMLRAIYYTLENTGMRAGELLGLHWDAINFKKSTLSIRYTRDEYGLRRPKTKTSRRTLTIDSKLLDILKQYYRYCRSHYKINSNSYVILGKQGKPLIANYVPEYLRKLLIESGLKKLVGRFTPHSFRHMFASKLIVDYHIDPLYVSRILGHANPSITMKIYAQLSANQSLNIKKILNNKLGK